MTDLFEGSALIAECKINGETVYLSNYSDGYHIETSLYVTGMRFPMKADSLSDAFKLMAKIAMMFE
ncbi:hypothetical protein [Ralstonia insidiosa]|uniref:Uncharacterized protein n=1 Tax=Ralstonia insidiosa TaxID=190721 RepID=A0A848P3T8_9RALS|nr:hypothetical protein [Ralstonia insidiosa]NMV39873.1 hypothetical protein [Ralstonia insidiosa]